jgi:ketosteroid isomerase-like protein
MITVGLLSAPACAAPPAEESDTAAESASTQTDPAEAEAALRTTFDEMIAAYNAEDVATIERLYAEDIVIIPPGEAVRADRATAMEQLATLTEVDYSIEAQIRDLMLSGDLAVTLVSYSEESVPRDGTATEAGEGRWAIVWTRTADGQWQMAREIWNLAPEQTEGG